jgi:lipopolysaccharide transport system ATP-binding protein
MSNTIVTVENLSKRYFIGHQAARRERSPTLRDAIRRQARSQARKALDLFCGRQLLQGDKIEEFWALKNVSFDVKRGEVLGIIGRNGAGKSTLLKILSRIAEPTEGRITLRGRLASLLEVGTGFHQELTGRENIFLNGAILGMTRHEIRTKFEEIVAFAEVERFIDTPVKRYSSGMYMRLAFAVAAHLDPDIVVVDEVLAVGDAAFQKKCIMKMNEVAQRGRAVLFVSHNMSAILQLTARALLLLDGRVDFVGPSQEAVTRYTGDLGKTTQLEFDVSTVQRQHDCTGDVRILALRFDRLLPHFAFLEPFEYIVRVRAERSVRRLRVSMTLFTNDSTPVGSCFSPAVQGLEVGQECDLKVRLEALRFAPGSYHCDISVGSGDNRTTNIDYDIVTNTLFFEVAPAKTPEGYLTTWHKGWGSISFPDLAIERALCSRV